MWVRLEVLQLLASGGSGTIHYQWYVDGSAVGTDSASYSYAAAGTSHSITCKVTDSASTPVTSVASNAVSVTVKAALVAPTVSASLSTINQGQTSSLISSVVSTGTSPYSYQWFVKSPGSESYSPISGAVLSSYSFATSVSSVTGTWSFELQVTDGAGVSVTSSAVSVTVNYAPLEHFAFNIMSTKTAGTSFSITIRAEDASDNTLTNYVGTNTLAVSTGTISPATTGAFSNGIWTGTVTVTGAGSGIWLITSGSSMHGTSNAFTVNPAVLDRFSVSSVTDQTTNSVFNIIVTALDAYGNTVIGYVGTPTLTYSAGSISPITMNAFDSGVGTTSITVTTASSGATITVTDGNHIGVSNSFAVTNAPSPTTTPTPTFTNSPTSTPHPTSSSTSTPKPSQSATPFPSTSPLPATSPSTSATLSTMPPEIIYYAIAVVIATIVILSIFVVDNYFKSPYKSLKL